MRVENGILFIEDEISDELAEEFLATISQNEIEKVELNCSNLGASIIQILLIKKREKEIVLNDPILEKMFENIVYRTI
jgi:hypothetical protein